MIWMGMYSYAYSPYVIVSFLDNSVWMSQIDLFPLLHSLDSPAPVFSFFPDAVKPKPFSILHFPSLSAQCMCSIFLDRPLSREPEDQKLPPGLLLIDLVTLQGSLCFGSLVSHGLCH